MPCDLSGRTASLLKLLPDVFARSNKGKSLLYVGANSSRFHYEENIREAGYLIDVLEAFKENVDNLKRTPWINTIHGDIRKFYPLKDYDVVFWWHGPEHVLANDLRPTVERIKTYAKTIVVGCPWGRREQGSVGGNPFEVHANHLYERDLEYLGFSVDAVGVKDVPPSHLTGVLQVR